jgi:hypothetical protein
MSPSQIESGPFELSYADWPASPTFLLSAAAKWAVHQREQEQGINLLQDLFFLHK